MPDQGAVINAIEMVGCCQEISAGFVRKINKLFPDAKVVTVTQVVDTRVKTNHINPSRAISIQDDELLAELQTEEFDVHAGTMGDKLAVHDLNVQAVEPGTVLELSGGVVEPGETIRTVGNGTEET